MDQRRLELSDQLCAGSGHREQRIYTGARRHFPVTNQTLAVTIPDTGNFYLAWNYSVSTGATTTNGQALAIDDISILGVGNTQTNPTATAAANPATVQAGSSTLLTVTVTPGLNPTSTGIVVTADLTAIGGSASQSFFDDGTHGDATANDNIFSFQATVPGNTAERRQEPCRPPSPTHNLAARALPSRSP